MNEYTYIIFDHNGRRLGKIEFGVRNSVPSAKEIKEAIKERSGGIPYMALLMIEGYKKNQNLKIEKIDDILSALLEGGKSIEKFTSNQWKPYLYLSHWVIRIITQTNMTGFVIHL